MGSIERSRITFTRREALIGVLAASAGALIGCRPKEAVVEEQSKEQPTVTTIPETTPVTTEQQFVKVESSGVNLKQYTTAEINKLKETAESMPWVDGKYQTFPRQSVKIGENEIPVHQDIDIGTLGPDVDTIIGVDYEGYIPSGAQVLALPEDGKVTETRVVFIKRVDVETVQLDKALGGDRFDEYKTIEHGGNEALDARARLHAINTARKHQIVYYLGDLGAFENQWGRDETTLLNRMIRAQRPSKPEIGIPEPDFVNPRVF